MDSLLEQIEEVQSENESVEETVSEYIQRRQADDQSRIAWVIIWAFVLTTGAIFLYVIVNTQLFCPSTYWREPAKFLAELVSSVLLPIVTLVLGYYFGKEKK